MLQAEKKGRKVMKPVWKGTISFGLVNIPIELYSAVREHVLGFKLLCGSCKSPISYERWCRKCHKEVAWENILKGLKLPDDKWFIITQENIKALKPERTESIEISEFVPFDQLEVIYYEHHYFVVPQKKAESSFYLLQKALDKSGKVAIGTFVMRDKEYVCAITPYHSVLLLTTLNYSYEIRDVAKIIDVKKTHQIKSSELKLAEQLIKQLSKKTFDLTAYKDTFAEKLKAAIKKGKKIKTPTKRPSRKKEESLMQALRASIKRSTVQQPVARAKAKKKPTLKAKQKG